jgi:histone acetyltransferase (RNA polymerase elongator complex component)
LADEVAFYGGSFTAIDAARQEAFLDAASVPGVKIRLSTRPDCVDVEVIARLLRYPVETVELGAQSMDDEVLLRSGRGHTAEDVRKASALIKNTGFKLILQAMAGLPGDEGTWADTARALAELHPDGTRIYPVVVIENTELCDMWRRGEYRALTVSEGADAAAEMLEIFEGAGIPVIRVGLNPTEDLSGGDAVAGAYHPALGEMARSRIFLKRILREVGGHSGRVSVYVPRGKTSQAVGIRRENILKLAELGITAKIHEDEALTGYNVRVSCGV